MLDYLELGKQEGAKIVSQTQLHSDPECKEGFFVPPPAFADVNGEMHIFKEESWGLSVGKTIIIYPKEHHSPLKSTVIPFSGCNEAITPTNSVDYGLTCAIFTRDSIKADRTAPVIDAGMVFINNHHRMALGVPFGGMKHSGYGREKLYRDAV